MALERLLANYQDGRRQPRGLWGEALAIAGLTEPRAAPNLAVTAASRKLEGERARMKEADSQSTRFEHLISELNHPAAGSLSRPNAT